MQRLEWRWTFGHRHDHIHRLWGVTADKSEAASLTRHFVHHHHVIRSFCRTVVASPSCENSAAGDLPLPSCENSIAGATCLEDRTSDIFTNVVVPVHAWPRSRCAPARAVQRSTMRNAHPLTANLPHVIRSVASALAGGAPLTRRGVKSSRRGRRWILTISPSAASSAQPSLQLSPRSLLSTTAASGVSATQTTAARTGAVSALPQLLVTWNLSRCLWAASEFRYLVTRSAGFSRPGTLAMAKLVPVLV